MTRKNLLRWLKSRRVAVLKGGWSRERPISLKTGAAVEASLKRLKIPFFSLDVNRHFIHQLKSKRPEFCFVALHGEFGEDGAVQAILDVMGIPYTGCGAKASALAMDKVLSKKEFQRKGVPTPKWMVLSKKRFNAFPSASVNEISRLLRKGSVFIKPVDQGSAIGAGRVDRPNEILPALKRCYRVSDEALIERYIQGRELTVGILGRHVLPVIEIIPTHRFYDFHSKYAKGGSNHLTPAPLRKSIAKKAQSLSLKAFRAIEGAVYSRVDLLLSPDGKMNVLEVNTIPGMTPTSLLPEAAKAAGFSFDDLVLEIIRFSLLERGIKS